MTTMSIKRIFAFVLILLLVYGGGYVFFYGMKQYMLYSGAERDFNYMSAGELQSKLNVKGNVETVTSLLDTEYTSSDFLGIPIKAGERKYYALPIGYQEEKKYQQYCVIAVTKNEDIEAIEKLLKGAPTPLDPNAPRFEFRGIVIDITEDMLKRLTNYLWDVYDTEFDIYHKNVKKNIVPYVIFVKNGGEDNYLLPIIAGGAIAVIGAGLFVLLAINTYRRKHMYD